MTAKRRAEVEIQAQGAGQVEGEAARVKSSVRDLDALNAAAQKRIEDFTNLQARAAGRTKEVSERVAGLARGMSALHVVSAQTGNQLAAQVAGAGDIINVFNGTRAAVDDVAASFDELLPRLNQRIPTATSRLIRMLPGLGLALGGAVLAGKALAAAFDTLNDLTGEATERLHGATEAFEGTRVGSQLLLAGFEKFGRTFATLDELFEANREHMREQQELARGFADVMQEAEQAVADFNQEEERFLQRFANTNIGAATRAELEALRGEFEGLAKAAEEAGADLSTFTDDAMRFLGEALAATEGPAALRAEFELLVDAETAAEQELDSLAEQLEAIGDVSRLSADGQIALRDALQAATERAGSFGQVVDEEMSRALEDLNDRIGDTIVNTRELEKTLQEANEVLGTQFGLTGDATFDKAIADIAGSVTEEAKRRQEAIEETEAERQDRALQVNEVVAADFETQMERASEAAAQTHESALKAAQAASVGDSAALAQAAAASLAGGGQEPAGPGGGGQAFLGQLRERIGKGDLTPEEALARAGQRAEELVNEERQLRRIVLQNEGNRAALDRRRGDLDVLQDVTLESLLGGESSRTSSIVERTRARAEVGGRSAEARAMARDMARMADATERTTTAVEEQTERLDESLTGGLGNVSELLREQGLNENQLALAKRLGLVSAHGLGRASSRRTSRAPASIG